MNIDQLLNDGFCILKFSDFITLEKLQNLIKQFLSFLPENWHLNIKSQDDHNQLIVALGQHIAQSDLLIKLIYKHIQLFKDLCGNIRCFFNASPRVIMLDFYIAAN